MYCVLKELKLYNNYIYLNGISYIIYTSIAKHLSVMKAYLMSLKARDLVVYMYIVSVYFHNKSGKTYQKWE